MEENNKGNYSMDGTFRKDKQGKKMVNISSAIKTAAIEGCRL
ncbi:MAG TPA: hypothetical protein VKZ56_09485 [Membranihabitans sp.]|nr:hypothetical protein [Membranihabitans sp.]